ncbi:fungal specific transcription factor domain-containing protein [Halogeometricum borinquense]|uniref:Fungal specific transcription factor domain-containing protein n=1 Tax=Halogeometricum borinquense TaxID=60847 RepID=A0A6C0UIC7_9EURY|nr:fungal specific transcription factor domain-containing protein [Halogeometricum borinquense]QIB75324.1 fungal specific transcription factor domain-containing protein [Halogeometricum borinquense]
MHTIIGALVEANSRDAALQNAKYNVFEPLVRQDAFDYFQTFDGPGTNVSGKGRWGDVPPVLEADSEDGRDWIESRFEAMTDAYETNAKRIDDFMQAIDGEYDELWEHRDDSLVRHSMHQLGKYEGWPVTLYDAHGAGIRNRDQLEDVLTYGDGRENTETYVALSDVHW